MRKPAQRFSSKIFCGNAVCDRVWRMLTGLLLLSMLAAQVPEKDSRLTELPNTDTHFSMPVYKSREAWEKRKVQLRRQILTASGLDPMPARNPLHAQIFGRIKTKDATTEK